LDFLPFLFHLEEIFRQDLQDFADCPTLLAQKFCAKPFKTRSDKPYFVSQGFPTVPNDSGRASPPLLSLNNLGKNAREIWTFDKRGNRSKKLGVRSKESVVRSKEYAVH